MLEYGHIKLHRKMTKWGWYKDYKTKDVFIHLLLTANYEDNEFEGIIVKRGQRIASYETLANETGLSVRNVRTAIKHLQKTQEVTSVSTSKYTVFTVVKYNDYQDNRQASDKQVTSNRQATDERPTSDRQASDNNVRKQKSKKAKESKKYMDAREKNFSGDSNAGGGRYDPPAVPEEEKSFLSGGIFNIDVGGDF